MATAGKEQAQPSAAAGGCDVPAAPAQGPATLQEVKREVQHLQERLNDLEHHPTSSPTGAAPAVFSDPDHPASTVQLQEVLPRIKDLAQSVGGMKELARLVTTLAEAKE